MSLFLASALFAAAAADRQLAPTGKWAIDYADAQCSLSRTFGTAADPRTLTIGTMPGRLSVDFVLIEPGVRGGDTRRAKLMFSTPTAAPFESSYAVSGPAKAGGRATHAYITREQFDVIGAATSIAVTVDGREASFMLSQMPAAIKALSACEADLLREWGYDPAVLTNIATPPEPLGSPAEWATDDDYPKGPLRRREHGIVTFRLDIDAAGKAGNCTVIRSSGFQELDETACKVIARRARFMPARDTAGAAVPSIFVSRYNWRIPG